MEVWCHTGYGGLDACARPHNRLALAATRDYLFERLRPAPGIGQDLSPICSNAERESDGFGWRAATSHHGVRFLDAPPDSTHGGCGEPVDTWLCESQTERAALSSHPKICSLAYIFYLRGLTHIAGFVQWQDREFVIRQRGFDSAQPAPVQFPCRLMAGHQILNLGIVVRVYAGEPDAMQQSHSGRGERVPARSRVFLLDKGP